MITDSLDPIAGYSLAASDLIESYDALSSEEVYAHLTDFLRPYPGDILADIGAGTGRDAAWFSELGYDVTAVEPVEAFLEYGARRYADKSITWLEDRLPALAHLRALSLCFNVITITGVWQHLSDPERTAAMRNLAKLTAPGGRVVLALRHGPGAPDCPVFPISDEDTRVLAERYGYQTLLETTRPSLQPENQAQGVHWTWLVLQKPC